MINENMSLFEQKRKAIYKNELIKFKNKFDRTLLTIFTNKEVDEIDETALSFLNSLGLADLFNDVQEGEAPYFASAFIELHPEVVDTLLDVEEIFDYANNDKLCILDLMYDYFSRLLSKECALFSYEVQFELQNGSFFAPLKEDNNSIKSWDDVNCPQYKRSKIVH